MDKKEAKLVPAEHLEQAKHNEDFAKALFALKSPHYDWVITLCFYSALHYIYYKIAPDHILNSHTELDACIRKEYKNNPTIWAKYAKIKNSSENCRYLPHLAKIFRKDRGFAQGIISTLDKLKKQLNIEQS